MEGAASVGKLKSVKEMAARKAEVGLPGDESLAILNVGRLGDKERAAEKHLHERQ